MFDHTDLRKGQPSVHLAEAEFKKRFLENFFDPTFEAHREALGALAQTAWENYENHRKAPITVKAGPEFVDPDYDLSVEWLETRNRLLRANLERQRAKPRILIVNGSPRNEHTCPGEESKTWRMVEIARKLIEQNQLSADILDLSRMTAEYGKVIHPCKGCVSTAMPLCHFPCSCYPNHSLHQAPDWMNEIYEQWIRADGVLILTPVHWYQTPTVFKLMMDRLVCADGGNPDPTSTHGKNAVEAKKLELKGWSYPKHLAGRAFAIVVHGDSAGAENVRRILEDWLTDMEMIPAGRSAALDRYIGYYEPYAISHRALDRDKNFVREIENTITSLIRQVQIIRNAQYINPDEGLNHPEQK